MVEARQALGMKEVGTLLELKTTRNEGLGPFSSPPLRENYTPRGPNGLVHGRAK